MADLIHSSMGGELALTAFPPCSRTCRIKHGLLAFRDILHVTFIGALGIVCLNRLWITLDFQ